MLQELYHCSCDQFRDAMTLSSLRYLPHICLLPLQVYPEMTVELLGSHQGQLAKTAVSQALAAGSKNKVEVQLKRLGKVLAESSTITTTKGIPPAAGNKGEKKSDKKVKKQKLIAEKKAERKSKGKKPKVQVR